MKALEEYREKVKKNAIEQWEKEGHTVFKNMEEDPVIDLLLSALSYQAFYIQKNIRQYEENTLRDFRDRTIPFHLIKPTPAFSIVETKMVKTSNDDGTGAGRILDETCIFEFKKSKFVPLLKTKIVNAELKNIYQQGKNIRIEIQFANPVENLSGLSFYIDTSEPIDIEAIRYDDYELPLIKPSQYNELPFPKWFNNAHLFLNQNYYLFGTYDYWQEIFLTNTCPLFYIGEYNTKEIPLTGETTIELEIILNSPIDIDISNKLKINCVPVVNVEKREITLDSRNPIYNLSSDAGEFLNLLYDKEDGKDIEEYTDSFLIRQHGVERYNPRQLLEQMHEIVYRYDSDYYAFQSISGLKNDGKLKKMQEIIDDMSDIVSKEFEKNNIQNHYYAVLKKHKNESINLNYLITSGESANRIRRGDRAIKAPNYLDRNKTILLLETKGGKNSIKDENEKENIAKYYFLTKDRLVTAADIRAFCRKELGDGIDNIDFCKKNGCIEIKIKLKADNPKIDAITLQRKIELRSTGAVSYQVHFW